MGNTYKPKLDCLIYVVLMEKVVLMFSHCRLGPRMYLLHPERTKHQIKNWIVQSSKEFTHTMEECVETGIHLTECSH